MPAIKEKRSAKRPAPFLPLYGHKYGVPAGTPAQPAADPLCSAVFSYFMPLFYRTISIFARGLIDDLVHQLRRAFQAAIQHILLIFYDHTQADA